MLGSSIPVENMNHLAMSFPFKREVDPSGDGELHSRQQAMRLIKLQLLFIVPSPENFDYNFLDRPPVEKLPRFASVRVPKGVPVGKIRLLISYIEGELQDIFGRSKRANFVMVCDGDSDSWSYSFDLPTIGVAYV